MVVNRLSEAEEMIMSVIWNSKTDLRGYDIVDLVKEKFSKEWKAQTTFTFLQRLKRKGYVSIYKDKKEYDRAYSFCHAEISKEEYLKERFLEMQNVWFDGNREEMKQFIET